MRRNSDNINRNRSFINHIINSQQRNSLVSSDFLVDQLWMDEEEASGVKIIELNSSISSKDSTSPKAKNYNHAWSYANSSRYEEKDDYTVNEEARRRRRMNMEHTTPYADVYSNRYFYNQAVQSDYNSYYNKLDAEFATPMSHQMNCFTIINNNESLKSDSSTDNENHDGVEVIKLRNGDEPNAWEHVYNDEVVPFESNKQQEKRTIWIYSYKNKRLLSENDYELVNIPSKDTSNTSTSCSLTDDETKVENGVTTASRLGSPIPTTYIPRLDLTLVQTLSTVTEITEPNKCHSKESSQEIVNIKPKNNWLTDRFQNNKVENTNIVNWLALSPRERRRRSINTELEISDLQKLREKEVTYAEGSTQSELSNNVSKIESSQVQVQVDIHSNTSEQERKAVKTSLSHKSAVIETKLCDSSRMSNIIPMNISYADITHEIDVDNIKLDNLNKPTIDIGTKFNKAEITDPIEKLESDNWITEERIERETEVYDYILEKPEEIINTSVSNSESVVEDSANTRLWLKNLRLMKPPEWAEYLPITCSPPSLHLSISLGSLSDKKSWFKRFTRCIKCCK